MSDNFVNYSNMTALITKIANKIKNAGHNFNDDDFVVENNEVSLIPAQRIFTGTQAEWNALTLAEKQTYGQANITDDESGTPEYYSTDEVKTNKVWVDGKPIYQRTIAITSPNTTTETNVSIAELGFTDIDKIFITSPSYIYLYINNMNQHVPITLGWGSGDLGIIPATDNSHNGYLVWKVGNNAWTSKNGYVTLMYTKTTD